MNKENKSFLQYFLSINYVKAFFYIFVVCVIIFAIFSFSKFIQNIVVAFIFSYIFNPLVSFFERKQLPRIFGVILIFIFISLIFIFFFFWLINYFPSQNELKDFQNKVVINFNSLINYLEKEFPLINWQNISNEFVIKFQENFSFTATIPKILSNLSNISASFIVILFSLFFFLLNEREIKRWFLHYIPNKYFEMTLITLKEVDNVFGSYIRGTLLESFIIGLITSIGWYICGFPFATAFISGFIAGLLNAIPYVGPIMGWILGLAFYVLNLIPADYVSILGLSADFINISIVVFIAQFIDQFLKPTILASSVKLHPIVVILGIIAGSNMFGLFGMLVAIPVIAVIKVVLSTVYRQLRDFGLLKAHIISINANIINEEN